MELDENQVYRKTIIPWYDSEAACLVVVVFMFLVVLFGLAGIRTADRTPEYQAHLWVPALLVVLASGVIVSTAARLVKRFVGRCNGGD